MTPILVRPVREQLEHDRVIRLLQQRWRRKYAVGINQGSETVAAVGQPDALIYPDVVLAPPGRPGKPEIVVEVETGESVNNLEAMAEWIRMGRLKAEFHLYEQVHAKLGAVAPKPDLVIYLQAPVDVLLARIARRGIAFEQQIERAYLTRLNEAYSRFFHEYDQAPLLIVNAASIDPIGNQADYEDLIGAISRVKRGRNYYNAMRHRSL